MNQIIENIYQRRAVRKYKDVSLGRDVIDELIMAGKMAPSAMNRQPWKFYVLTDPVKIKKISKDIEKIALKKLKEKGIKELAKLSLSLFHLSTIKNILVTADHVFYGAPVVIFITHQRDDEWGMIDIGMCAQNIMLAAKAKGLDSCPVGFAKFVMQTDDYSLLKIPDDEVVDLAVVIGYGDEIAEMPKRTNNHVIYL
ncbi:5,6-dimethylbenzimidazole synthase [compost metagenome]